MAKKQKNTETQAAAPAPEAPPAPTAQPKQNGVTRPRTGTATGRVWEISDQLSASAGQPAARADVMKAGEAEGLNAATIATQYGRWRKFHGLGRTVPAAAAAAGAPVEGTPPEDAPEVEGDDEEDEDEDEEEE